MRLRSLFLGISLVLASMLFACTSATPRPAELIRKLIRDVIQPQPGEVVLVMTDLPHGNQADNEPWRSRREMAGEWRAAFESLADEMGLEVLPVLSYPATGNHNSQLPETGEMGGKQVQLGEILPGANIVVALTEFSATAPLIEYSQLLPAFRAVSMPMVHAGMMKTAMAADYLEVARKCNLLQKALDGATRAELVFSTGDELTIDLRHRIAKLDDGQLPADKKEERVINLPSGEVYIAPYEGELPGQPSLTMGVIPVIFNGELLTVEVQNNHLDDISGDKPTAISEMQRWLNTDDARHDLAELGLGCNDQAIVTGNMLEDEKVLGVHLAFGRSDHIGGVVGADDFSDPDHVVHLDVVYPFNSDLFVEQMVLVKEDGTREALIEEGAYTIFPR